MEVNIKKLSLNAVIPSYAKSGDAGMDITATSMFITADYIEYGTGLAIEVPNGHVALLFPRSSLSNYHLTLANHVGVVDSGYRGEVKFRFKVTEDIIDPKVYKTGDKIGQIMIIPYPQVNLIEVDELSDSDRGTAGYGSTGK